MTRSDYLAIIDAYGGYFKLREFEIQDSIDSMDLGFLQSFLAWRQWTGIPTMITSAWRRNDPNSHGEGKAIDCLLFTKWKDRQATALNHWLLATTWPFHGVGLYVDWSYKCPTTKAEIQAIGLHVDGWAGSRPGQRPQRWLRICGLYYYQSTADGTFFCKTNKKSITLQEAITAYDTQTAAI